MKILYGLIVLSIASTAISAPKNFKILSLKRAGVHAIWNHSQWDRMAFPESMMSTSPDLFLTHKKDGARTRLIYTTFLNSNQLCRRERRNLKKLGTKVKTLSRKGFACVLKIGEKSELQYMAIMELRRKGPGRKSLPSQVIAVETQPKSYKRFLKWIGRIERL